MIEIEVNDRLVLDALQQLMRRMGESVYRIQLTAKEYDLGNDAHKMHALESFEIEDAALGTLHPTTPITGAEQDAQPTTRRTISIKQLLHDAIRHDGKRETIKANAINTGRIIPVDNLDGYPILAGAL